MIQAGKQTDMEQKGKMMTELIGLGCTLKQWSIEKQKLMMRDGQEMRRSHGSGKSCKHSLSCKSRNKLSFYSEIHEDSTVIACLLGNI